ncbi:glycosyltransferase family 4 protein [Bdellovibrio sp. HCB274]|uniref:glycosyltransferase family 4 protein n=1 Tax=Bdellovibrio sp. HCB274 TaxID=3394361 RepID=UPI0039B697A2
MLLITVWPFILALAISAFAIPIIIRVADAKHLMDEPDSDRKFHSHRTPTLGGVAIFAGTVISFSAMIDYIGANYDIKFMVPAFLLLFFTGIKDDILNMPAVKKLMIQFIAAALLTVFGTMRLTNLWGMLGITDISPVVGMALTFILIVALINAFNLIDGVDGLAGGLGFIASMFFGSWFALTNSQALSILSFSLAGALLGFLFFNIHKAKIFMGDTGSMLIGFVISILVIKFIENNRLPGIEQSPYYIKAAPGVAVAAVMIPLFDMSRVFFQRIIKKRSPFKADRNHIHHMLIDLKLSTTATTLFLYVMAIALIVLSLFLKELRSMELLIVLIVIVSFVNLAVILIRRKKQNLSGTLNV